MQAPGCPGDGHKGGDGEQGDARGDVLERELLARAEDAEAWRTPSGECAGCDPSGTGLRAGHAGDFGLCRAYRELGAEPGLKAKAG